MVKNKIKEPQQIYFLIKKFNKKKRDEPSLKFKTYLTYLFL